jgi:hypothetical protein
MFLHVHLQVLAIVSKQKLSERELDFKTASVHYNITLAAFFCGTFFHSKASTDPYMQDSITVLIKNSPKPFPPIACPANCKG